MRSVPSRRSPIPSTRGDVTEALLALRLGAPDAFERLMRLVYEDLRRVADRKLARERADHTLTPTALVHEAFLRLVDQRRADWTDRVQFFAVAARMMRRVLVDHARRRQTVRRGAAPMMLSLDGAVAPVAAATSVEDIIALDAALEELAGVDARLARVVELKFFAGLSEEETAQALGVTARTVSRDWAKARGWLFHQLRSDGA